MKKEKSTQNRMKSFSRFVDSLFENSFDFKGTMLKDFNHTLTHLYLQGTYLHSHMKKSYKVLYSQGSGRFQFPEDLGSNPVIGNFY